MYQQMNKETRVYTLWQSTEKAIKSRCFFRLARELSYVPVRNQWEWAELPRQPEVRPNNHEFLPSNHICRGNKIWYEYWSKNFNDNVDKNGDYIDKNNNRNINKDCNNNNDNDNNNSNNNNNQQQ